MNEVPTSPDPLALRRRVLQTGLVTLALFLVLAFTISSAGLPDVWLALAMVAVYVLVVRPMLRPVRAANRLRRERAHEAFLDAERDEP